MSFSTESVFIKAYCAISINQLEILLVLSFLVIDKFQKIWKLQNKPETCGCLSHVNVAGKSRLCAAKHINLPITYGDTKVGWELALNTDLGEQKSNAFMKEARHADGAKKVKCKDALFQVLVHPRGTLQKVQ